MKKILILSLLSIFSGPAFSGALDSVGTYTGKVKSIAVGHWGNIGVELDGATCNEQKEVILLVDGNPLYKDHLALLLAAQASQQDVVMYRLTSNTQAFSASHTYCILKFAAIGDFSTW